MPQARPEVLCFHCGLPVAPEDALGLRWSVLIDGEAQVMCCPGCQAVAQAIVDLGQQSYYRERSAYAASADAAGLLPPQLALYDEDSSRFARSGDDYEAVLSVDGIRCAACVWLIEKRLLRLPGVREANMNVATERLHLRWDGRACKLSTILAALREIGYPAFPFDATRHGERLRKNSKQLARRLFVAGMAMMQVMMYAVPAYLADDGTLDAPMAALLRWASLLLTLPAVAYSAWPFFRGAWISLRARAPGMDVPVVLGIVAAFGASAVATVRGTGEVYFDSVTMFVFLLLCSRYLELAARRRAALALERLQHALPASASRMDAYPDSRTPTTVAASQLAAGDVILVRQGEACAADGQIIEGEGAIDLSLLTGESAAQPRKTGEMVAGGAVNLGAALTVRVVRAVQDSTLAGLIKLVDRAGQGKPRIAQWADLVASRFVVGLLLFALAVFGYWCWADAARAWPIAIAVLVVSCPCALSLATPTALAAATDALLRRGVLVVQSHVLETLHRATHIVFDKTGTLTEGRPVVVRVELLGALGEHDCLALAAALEAGSAHPLARAFVGRTRGDELAHGAASNADASVTLHASELREFQSQGMEGRIHGQRYRIGNAAHAGALAGRPLPRPKPLSVWMPLEAGADGQGGSELFLAAEGRWLARFTLADTLRPDAAEVVRYFRAAGKIVMLVSGDQQAIADRMGHELGIASAHGACLPEQKLALVREMQAGGAVVAMVGDGINDAAVLSAADVSFAMGSGSALAQIHADAVLLSGRLSGLADAARKADATMAVIGQNLAWATLYNLVAIPAAALGWVSPWLSGVGMAASSALVVANALRLRRTAGPRS